MRGVILGSAVLTLAAAPLPTRACPVHGEAFVGSSALPGGIGGTVSGPAGFPSGVPFVPAYSSLPGAHTKIYLDFDGDFTSDWGYGLVPGQTPAYDRDGDTGNFSTSELADIHEVWQRVSEKFSIFNINVTTVDPGNDNDLETMHVVIGGDGRNGASTYWPGGRYGGIAYVGGFSNPESNKVFVFPGNLLNGDPKRVAEASSHESGHGFFLLHQSVYDGQVKTNEYNPGDEHKAPIMGRSYDSERGLWWNGPSSLNWNQVQNDLAVMGNPYANGFGFRTDDHGGTIATADPMNITSDGWSASGIIGFFDFADCFTFTTLGGELGFAVDVAPLGAMLDASLDLYAMDGSLLASSATSSLAESFTANLAPGTYALAVTSAGGFGDLGQYSLRVSVPEPVLLGATLPLALFLRRRR